MRKFSEKLEWGRFYNSDTKEYLDNVFIEFTNPLDKGYIGSAKTYQVKSGNNMMALYVVEIPIRQCQPDIIINLLEDIKVIITRIKSQLPGLGHSIELIEGKIKLNIWSND